MTEIMQSSSLHLIPARRAFLARSGGAVLSAAAAIALLAGRRGNAAEQQKAGASTSNDVNILNTALAGEYEAAAAYQVADFCRSQYSSSLNSSKVNTWHMPASSCRRCKNSAVSR